MEMATEWTRRPRGGDMWLNAQMISEVNVLPPAGMVCCDLRVHLIPRTLSPLLARRNTIRCVGEKHCPIALIPGIQAVSTGEMLTDGISLGTRWDRDSGHNREKANGKKGVRWRF